MTTEEGNKLIAEFMGLKTGRNGAYLHKTNFYNPDALMYHTSWDWLMPVVEKIKNLHEGNSHNSHTRYKIITINICEVDIKNTWLAVVEFIKWHNEQLNNLNHGY